MIDRSLWDTKNKYTQGLLKEYDHWALEVSYRQHTLGCYIIFAKRSVEKISELSTQEINELKDVMSEIEKTLSKINIFKPDRINYLQLGNKCHHLHFHGVPRYNSPRTFVGKGWIDKAAGILPTWSYEDVGHELVAKLRDAIKPCLPGN
jgi:diadenosine tetraphosphate (Ap4A) HIT family hydrolase